MAMDYTSLEMRKFARELASLKNKVDSSITTQQLGRSSIEAGGSFVVKDSDSNEVLQVGGQ